MHVVICVHEFRSSIEILVDVSSRCH